MTLDELFNLHGTDKGSNHHNYSPVYEKFFEPIRNNQLTIFEIGVGGYHYPERGGGDLFAFANYFPKAEIHAIDIYEKKLKKHPRINIYQCSETDAVNLSNILNPLDVDIMLNDGSHNIDNIIMNFQICFPFLKVGGLFIVEDCHATHWAGEYGGSEEHNAHTYFNSLGLNIIHQDEKLIIIRK